MSTAISHIIYNKDTQELTVSFAKGGSHSYSNVPPALAEAFKAASSQGKFFNQNIRGLSK